METDKVTKLAEAAVKVAKQMSKIKDEIKENPEMKEIWISNIATFFQDEYEKDRAEKTFKHPKEFIHKISNEAAEKFINFLIDHKDA